MTTKSKGITNNTAKSLNDLCQDELTVIGSFINSWNDLWSLTFTSVDLKIGLMDQQNDKLWKYFLITYFPYIPLPKKDFYKTFLDTYKVWYKTLCLIEHDPFLLMCLNSMGNNSMGAFKNDREIVLAAIKRQPALYKNFSREYKEDDEVILYALKKDRFIINDVPNSIRKKFQEIADIKDNKTRSEACDELIIKLSLQRISKIKSLYLFKNHLNQTQDITRRNNGSAPQMATGPVTPSVVPLINLGLFHDTQTKPFSIRLNEVIEGHSDSYPLSGAKPK
jgi:hypothetical protein